MFMLQPHSLIDRTLEPMSRDTSLKLVVASNDSMLCSVCVYVHMYLQSYTLGCMCIASMDLVWESRNSKEYKIKMQMIRKIQMNMNTNISSEMD